MKHTPTPWITDGVVIHPKDHPGNVVAATVNANSTMYVSTIKDWAEQNANAEFIVRAANCHDELLQIAIDILPESDDYSNGMNCDECGTARTSVEQTQCDVPGCFYFRIRAAIAKAKGEPE